MTTPLCPFAEFADSEDCGRPAPYTTTMRLVRGTREHASPRCAAHRFSHNEAWEVVSVTPGDVAHTASDF